MGRTEDRVSRAPGLKVADAVWIATALLHRDYPESASFTQSDIRAQAVSIAPDLRSASISAHISTHAVANVKPNGGHYRLLFGMSDGSRRLYRPSDPAHADRKGKMTPSVDEIPQQYRELLTWYKTKYANVMPEDPIRAMWGFDYDIWCGLGADDYVNSLRSGWTGEET